MEGITATLCRSLKECWSRRGYQRLNGSGRRRRNRVELGSTRNRRGRFWRWRIKMSPKIRIRRIPSPKKMLTWLRDAYVRMMLGLANSRVSTMGPSSAGFGGAVPGSASMAAMSGFGRARPKEYEEKVIVQIYKSLLMGPLVANDAARIAAEISCRR